MGPGERKNERDEPSFKPNESLIEKCFGSYVEIALGSILFLSVLIVLTCALFVYEKHSGIIITGLLTAFGSFGGFIVGKKRKKK